jgi:hypothetical protein
MFHCLLALDRGENLLVSLDEDEAFQTVLLREAFNRTLAVLEGAPRNVSLRRCTACRAAYSSRCKPNHLGPFLLSMDPRNKSAGDE